MLILIFPVEFLFQSTSSLIRERNKSGGGSRSNSKRFNPLPL
ncbi:hypothetical protein LEP1GSC074_2400 [Leptospira noguchii str. Hook]|nr:hypothetical protein LEP1GSC170_5913 [Leptospira interrogans serovar Bataviae str. HAI135]EMS89420.1 hypothetical protein LEP1GSC074_2400 [Leptospira noguchii str. Hook]